MARKPLQIAVLGSGRMGSLIVDVIGDTVGCAVAGIWSRQANTDLATLLSGADVAIDFTLPEACGQILVAAAGQGTPLVSGVTGLGPAELAALDRAAQRIPVLYDRNMSRGIAVMEQLLRQAAGLLGKSFDVQIREIHHVHKKDAPSGTAIAMREALGDESIAIESRREGEVLGDHVVSFTSPSETLEITHSVANRRVFAEGAVAAARWLVGKPPGRYRMADIWR